MHGNKGLFITMQKKGQLILKTPGWLYSKYRCIKKSFLMKTSKTWPHFFLRIYFLQDFISCDLISWNFITRSHINLGKKVPGIKNTGLYVQWHFFQGLEKIRTFFQNLTGFFPETFFPRTFFHRFMCEDLK